MQSNKLSLAGMLGPQKHFDTSGKSLALFQHRAVFKSRADALVYFGPKRGQFFDV
jgi:hypothetical protein